MPGIANQRTRRGSNSPLLALDMDALPTAANRGDAITIQKETTPLTQTTSNNTALNPTPVGSYKQMAQNLTDVRSTTTQAPARVPRQTTSNQRIKVSAMRESSQLKPKVAQHQYNTFEDAVNNYAPGSGAGKARAIRDMNQSRKNARIILDTLLRDFEDRDDYPDFARP